MAIMMTITLEMVTLVMRKLSSPFPKALSTKLPLTLIAMGGADDHNGNRNDNHIGDGGTGDEKTFLSSPKSSEHKRYLFITAVRWK
eukprot:10061986-Ditylum_brightwellii.AAC.1